MLPALRYFPWYLRDMLLTRGGVMLAIAMLLMMPALLMDFPEMADPPDMAALLAESLQGMTIFLTLVATYGIVGEDVRRGYFRNLFSKPVSPMAYYALAFTAAMTVFLLTLLLATTAFAVIREPVWPARALIRASVEFFLLGSVIFGLSRLTRVDWLVGVLLHLFGQTMRGLFPPDESLRGAVLNVVLPPSHLLGEGLYDATWILVYGLVFIAVGLVSVRLLAFGTQRS